ncbi:MAG: hypothetical protein CSA61_00555 [Neptuniibacter caesariensis]|uniref:Peptide O-xylosyltransferase n=1 Tax=Neptuniibacter caesariensis TaxID=207954 RepID=A0A2G6JDW5_NEPCE|nr:MAG: hypothetical protein CSA61_00555 [Neptuniibacter caesariensis]
MINYIILAHKNPHQLKRLIDRLDPAISAFFIHIDKHVDIGQFQALVEHYPNVKFVHDRHREECIWGDISLVKATINASKLALKYGNKSGYCVLLSGQDYPIKSNSYINKVLSSDNEKCYIDTLDAFEYWDNYGEADKRFRAYNLHPQGYKKPLISIYPFAHKKAYSYRNIKAIYRTAKIYGWSKIGSLNLRHKREDLSGIDVKGGSQWWALPFSILDEVISFIEANSEYIQHHENTHVPDEVIFNSVVFHLVEKRRIYESLTFVKWGKDSDPHPLVLDSSNLNELESLSSGKLFARKFEPNSSVLDALDV